MSEKKYAITCLVGIIVILTFFLTITYIFDPFFHYHKPYEWVSYKLSYQRYQNDGILKNFDYNAIISGTSMIENFRTSELDKLFDVDSIKVSFAGASFKEVNDNLITALNSNKNIKLIIRSLDLSHLFEKYDSMRYENDYYPWYLYDSVLYNDVKYVFNKSIFFDYTMSTIINTLKKTDSTSFDDYSASYNVNKYGKSVVDAKYKRSKKSNEIIDFTSETKKIIEKTFKQNIIQIAEDNPNVDFYLFFTPYSIYYYDDLNQQGRLNLFFDAYEYIINMLLKCKNIHVFSFIDEYEIITNLDNYRDQAHYDEKINSKMLVWMKEGHGLITYNNIENHMNNVRNFYTNFDYDSLFE